MNDELHLLRAEYNRLNQRIQPFDGIYSIQTERSDDGSPHVEFSEGQFHYIVTERGLDLETRSTPDIREIVYWMLYDVTFWMGVEFEFKNRIETQDCRRIIFAKQRELMSKTDAEYVERLDQHIHQTLAANPFVDQKS